MIGPPTAGKSRLVKELRKSGIKRGPEGNIKKIPKEWRFFAEMIDQFYKDTTLKSLPDKTRRSLAAAWIGSKSKEWMVFDELLILCGFSLAIRRPKEEAIQYFKNAPLPEVLIYLTAKTDILMERNRARGEGDRSSKTLRCIDAHEKFTPILYKRKCRIWKFDTEKYSTHAIADKVLYRLDKIKGFYNAG